MSERSEFGRRPLVGEKRRGPTPRSGGGSRQEPMVLVTFAETKVTYELRKLAFIEVRLRCNQLLNEIMGQ